jgi:uncharacterized protein (DUF2336 family)
MGPSDAPIMAEIARTMDLDTGAGRSAVLSRVARHFLRVAPTISEPDVQAFDVVFLAVATPAATYDRTLLAKALASVTNAPLGTIRFLAMDDEIVVADPVIRLSPRLSDEVLAEIAALKSHEHLCSMTLRTELAETVTDAIIIRGDTRVLLLLVNNRGARFSQDGGLRLARTALADADLRQAVQRRADLAQALVEARQEQEQARSAAKASPPKSDADGMIAAELQSKALARALNIVATEASTSHRVVARAFATDPLNGFVAIARAANLEWGTVVELLSLRLGAGLTPGKQREAQGRFDELSRADAQRLTRILSATGNQLYS